MQHAWVVQHTHREHLTRQHCARPKTRQVRNRQSNPLAHQVQLDLHVMLHIELGQTLKVAEGFEILAHLAGVHACMCKCMQVRMCVYVCIYVCSVNVRIYAHSVYCTLCLFSPVPQRFPTFIRQRTPYSEHSFQHLFPWRPFRSAES